MSKISNRDGVLKKVAKKSLCGCPCVTRGTWAWNSVARPVGMNALNKIAKNFARFNTEMNFGKASSERNTPDYGNLLVGLSTAGFTAIIPRLYRSTGGITQPRFFGAMLAAPLGSVAAFSWHRLVSRPIKSQKLNCAGCASIRGSLVLLLTGCLLPSSVVMFYFSWRKTSLQQQGVFAAFIDFCYSPYYGRSKPYIIALGVFQTVLGYGLASWIYNEEFIKRRNGEKEL